MDNETIAHELALMYIKELFSKGAIPILNINHTDFHLSINEISDTYAKAYNQSFSRLYAISED